MQLTFLQEDLANALRGNAKTTGKKPNPSASSVLLPLAAKTKTGAVKKESAAVTHVLPAEKTSSPQKSENAFKTISEAANVLDVPQHVLRFWESKFPQIKPTKLAGGRRYYRPEDMDVLTKIHHLLYKQGYTIKGALKAFSKPENDAALAQKVSSLPKIAIDKTKAHFSGRQISQIASIRLELMDLKETLRPYL